MKINQKILSIPPYISTSWEQISSLKAEKNQTDLDLHIVLQDGSQITIPSMGMAEIEKVFSFHAKHLEEGSSSRSIQIPNTQVLSLPNLRILSKLGSFCEHDPNSSDSPLLPPAILEQFTEVAKSLPITNPNHLPRPEPHCNCPYCQITKAIHESLSSSASIQEEEEEVSDADLYFTSWIIEPISSKGYKVISPDNKEEYYLVSLDTPLQCSCGQTKCSHIQAVLRS